MHVLNLMHRDIKPANILLSQDCSVKICDMGLSRCMPRGKVPLKSNENKFYEA